MYIQVVCLGGKNREAMLQVEVARLQYLLPRLVGLHDALFRQAGTSGSMSSRGSGEKNKCRKMLMEIYGIEEFFFKEIDQSIKRHCRNVNEVRNYLFLFQGFSQELMMLMGNIMKWKFRIPNYFQQALRNLTAKAINDVLTKNSWKDEGVRKACLAV